VAKPNERYLYSTASGDVFATRRTGIFTDAGIALLRLHEYARRASGEKKDFRLVGPGTVSPDRARHLYLQTLVHLHSYLIAGSIGARTHFFERLRLFADSAAKLNGLVGLLVSGVGHFFHTGDTAMCEEIRRVLLTKWNLFSPDADVSPFIVADHSSRLISFLDGPQVRLFVDCLVDLSDVSMTKRVLRNRSATQGAAGTRNTSLHERGETIGPGLSAPADFDRVGSGGALGSFEGRAEFLGALVAATGFDFGKSHQQFQSERDIGEVFEIAPGAFGRPGIGGLHDKGLWLDLELGPHVYGLTDEDRETMCVGIVSLVSGAVGAIEGEDLRPGVGTLGCPLICSTASDENQIANIANTSVHAGDEGCGEELREAMQTERKHIEDDDAKAKLCLETVGAGDERDMLDVLGIKAELAMNVGKGMRAFLARRGSCYALPQCLHSGSSPATVFLDERRQRETIAVALRARIDRAFEIDLVAHAPEELSKRFIWYVDPAL
jgi:hypothetical protein